MNIFILDTNPINAARMHCDEHVSKMILESAQMLCTAAVEYYGIPQDQIPYKATHKNHPCTKWVGESTANVQWLAHLINELELVRRAHGKLKHSSNYPAQVAYEQILNQHKHIAAIFHTPFAIAIAPEYRLPNCTDPVTLYRHYYSVHKPRLMKRGMHWTLNSKPDWMNV